LDDLCATASLGFALVTLHAVKATIPCPKFDFICYNPRIPPKDAIKPMSRMMEHTCKSDEHNLMAVMPQATIKNLSKL